MPLPSRDERAAVRDKALKDQQKRNAEAFAANGYAEHDAEVAKTAKATRARAQVAASSGSRPGSRRILPPASKKAEK